MRNIWAPTGWMRCASRASRPMALPWATPIASSPTPWAVRPCWSLPTNSWCCCGAPPPCPLIKSFSTAPAGTRSLRRCLRRALRRPKSSSSTRFWRRSRRRRALSGTRCPSRSCWASWRTPQGRRKWSRRDVLNQPIVNHKEKEP